MTKSMARNEVETTYRLDVLERKMGDLQERMNRMETLLQGMINPQTRVNEKRPMQDLGQPGDLDREMARRVDDLKQIVATGWEQDQLPDESTPEGNSKLPSTGLSLVATGWGEDPKPHAVIASPTLNNPNPSHGPEMAKDMEKGVSAVAEKHALIEGVVLNTLDKQIRHFTGSGNTPMVYPLKPVIEEIQKSDLAQLYVVGRADKRLRCTGLFWKLPPWPDFCAMSGDSFAQHCGYEVIESFYSMKQNNHSVLDYTVKFEELIKIWSIMNEDYYARVEGWEITSNFSKAVGLATRIAVKRSDLDNIDEYVRNTIARAFNVMASALGISAFLPFLKAVDFISPLMDALYASYYTKEVMQALIREFQSPDEEMKKIVLKVVIQSVNTESVEADYIRNDIPPEFLCHFWVGVADIIGRIVENLKDESEPYLPQNGSTIKWRLNNKSAKVRRQAADLISRIAIVTKQCQEEQLMGYLGVVLYEFCEKASSFEKSMKYKKLANAQIPNRRFTLGVVEYTEGVGMQTETVLRQALGEKIRPVLTVSKMDRCFLELQVKEKETVAFSASLHGWAFTLSSFAKMYASKFGVEESKMMERFWGENFFDPTTKKWTTKKTGSATCKRDFVQFYYEPMKQIIKTCMNDQKDKLWLILRKLGVTLKTDEKELMGMTLFMRKGLTLWSGLPFEDQPVELYTVPMFQAFQDEIKQLMHVPCKEVARSGSSITYLASGLIQGKRVDYTVVYNNADKDVWCICHSFPSRGTPCSPVLAVLEQENVFMLSSKYILNRWRKDFRILHAFICSSYVASKRGLSLYDDLYMSGHEYLGDITDSGARELELKEFLLSVLKEAKDKLLRPIQTRHSDQRVDVNMAVIGQAYADRRVDANMASNTTALFHGDGKVDMKMAFPHLMQGNTRVDMNMVSTARTRIHTFDLVNDYFVEIRVPEDALGGYNDEMRVLLPAIVKQIADFEVKPNRFSALKEISVKDYQNFNFSQPYSQASYYLSLILEDKQWPLVEKLEAPSKLESDSFAKFVPHLLLKTYLECYVQGDTKPSEAKSIVQEIEEIIFNTPNSVFNPLSPSQYLTKRVIMFENELNFYYQIEGLNQKNENSSVVQYIQVHQDDAVSNIKLQLFSLIASHPAFNQLRTVKSPGHTTRDCYNHVNMQDHQILISILEDKYGFEGRVMSDPAIGEELKKGLKSEENVSLLFSESI